MIDSLGSPTEPIRLEFAMSKRKLEDTTAVEPPKKQRKNHGFSVGPANLPDGTYRRKTQKIKNDLISKAKVKKSYARLKLNDEGDSETKYDPYTQPEDPARPGRQEGQVKNATSDVDNVRSPTNEIHPERQAMLNAPEEDAVPPKHKNRRERKPRGRRANRDDHANPNATELGGRGHQRDATRPVRYQKEFALAEEKTARDAAREAARQQRIKERKAMIKARRPGKDGKQKLGRQSDILLNRVKRLVGKD